MFEQTKLFVNHATETKRSLKEFFDKLYQLIEEVE